MLKDFERTNRESDNSARMNAQTYDHEKLGWTHGALHHITKETFFFNIILFWLFVGVGALVRYKLPKK